MALEQRTIVVGDVHGCARELDDLLDACGFRWGDHLVFVGDLVAKGPDSTGVLRRAMGLGARAVRGNHEDAVLRARNLGGTPKTSSGHAMHHALAAALDQSQWEWLSALPLALPLPEHNTLVVHAGLVPGVPLTRQRAEDLLCMRSISADGKPSKRVSAGDPWAKHWQGPEFVCFGHDAITGLQRHPHALGLDTGCVYGKSLTAWILPEGRLCSVPARDTYVAVGLGPAGK